MESESDEDLMNLYLEGDLRAFNALYTRHKSLVFGYLVKRLSSKESAEEIFQTAFLKLHNARGTYQPSELFLPWFFSIVKNCLFDHLRKVQNEDRKITAYQSEHSASPFDPFENPSFEELETGLAYLTTEQRNLVHKRYFQGLEFTEIAQEIDSNATAVRQSVSRLHRKLKSILKGVSS